MRWAELAATLAAPPPGAGPALELQPLPPMERSARGGLAPTRSLASDWAIATSPGGSPRAQRSKPPPVPAPPPPKLAAADVASGFLPYARAGLHPWLEGVSHSVHSARPPPTPPPMPASAFAADAASPLAGPPPPSPAAAAAAAAAGHEYLGAGPGAVLDLSVTGFELCVPYDREPGPAQRYGEMYFKAVRSAFTERLQVLRKRTGGGADPPPPPPPPEAAARRGGSGAPAPPPPPPLQVNLALRQVAVRFEHHPLEAWLSVHGPLLQRLAVQQHLWEEAAATVRPSDAAASPLHAGMMESACAGAGGEEAAGPEGDEAAAAGGDGAGSAAAGGDQAWEGLMADLARGYKAEAQRAEAEAAAAGGRACDLFCVHAEAVQALVVVVGGGGAGGAAARAHIADVDPPSAGVQLLEARKIHTDAALHGLEVRVGCASQPLLAAARLGVAGALAAARQATAPAEQARRLIPVGAHRAVGVRVNARGCRAPFKVYTDLAVDARALAVCFTPGMEPFLAQVGLAGKRLAPSDPDKTAARPPPVPWFDDLRYFWRGRATVRAAPLEVTLAAHSLPLVDATSPRMRVAAAAAEGRLEAGEAAWTLRGLACTLYQAAGVEHGGGAVLVLPFIHSPVARVSLRAGWRLPGGRDPEDHHLFPAEVGPGTQLPVLVSRRCAARCGAVQHEREIKKNKTRLPAYALASLCVIRPCRWPSTLSRRASTWRSTWRLGRAPAPAPRARPPAPRWASSAATRWPLCATSSAPCAPPRPTSAPAPGAAPSSRASRAGGRPSAGLAACCARCAWRCRPRRSRWCTSP